MPNPQASPAALGFRAVAEWEHNAACWTAWPYDAVGWGGFLPAAQREFVGFCEALLAAPGEPLRILAPDGETERTARRALPAARIQFERLAYGDIWLRDTTPIFVRREGNDGRLGAVRFAFNGWGGKYIYPGDVELSAALARHLGLLDFAYDAVLEGGALELDGEGTCLTTESCLLNPNRGPGLTRARLEEVLRAALGVRSFVWLQEGLAGDHTDGHIDNIARFVAPGVVMHTRAGGPDDPNASAYQAIEAGLAAATDAAGRRLRLLPVPSPGLVPDAHGEPLAASHLNFYVGNQVVVVPGFGGESDEPARRAIAAAFPERRVVVRSARAILEGGGGTFHCMTRQEPRSPA